jgi:hypothetical protein
MMCPTPGEPTASMLAHELTRRQVLARTGSLAAAAALAMHLSGRGAAAQHATPAATSDSTPIAVDPDRYKQLMDLSLTLCGGGNFSDERGAVLYQLIFSDPALVTGFDQLIAQPPVPGQPIQPDSARSTSQVILNFWYGDYFDGEPLPDRGSAYYQMTSWQAMYTFSWAVCHAYGAWAHEPSTDPIIPALSVS